MIILIVTNRGNTFALGYRSVFEPLYKLSHKMNRAADFSGFVA